MTIQHVPQGIFQVGLTKAKALVPINAYADDGVKQSVCMDWALMLASRKVILSIDEVK
jgi:hypothetical protein